MAGTELHPLNNTPGPAAIRSNKAAALSRVPARRKKNHRDGPIHHQLGLVQRTPLGGIERISPVSSEISQARRTSLHHSFASLPFASPMNFNVASSPWTQAMENAASFCGAGTTSASVTTNEAGTSAAALAISRLVSTR